MSIKKRVMPFSRSSRTLIKKRADMAKVIKDLKDLSVLRWRAGYRHSGLTDLKRTRDGFSVARTMARDRPSPYGEVPFFPVARGPVPRDRCIARARTMARDTRSDARVETCEGPRPTMKRAFCRRGSGRRAALLHRDQEGSPTAEYETPSVKFVREHRDFADFLRKM